MTIKTLLSQVLALSHNIFCKIPKSFYSFGLVFKVFKSLQILTGFCKRYIKPNLLDSRLCENLWLDWFLSRYGNDIWLISCTEWHCHWLCFYCHRINSLRRRRNRRHFANEFFINIFLNKNVWISIVISLRFVPKGKIDNIPALVHIMAWHRPSDKPLSEPTMVGLPTHICVTRPHWFNCTGEWYIRIYYKHHTIRHCFSHCRTCDGHLAWWLLML